jgi:hypothetical protein
MPMQYAICYMPKEKNNSAKILQNKNVILKWVHIFDYK